MEQPKPVTFRIQRASDDQVISNIITDSARCKRTGLRDLSRKKMQEQGTALYQESDPIFGCPLFQFDLSERNSLKPDFHYWG